MISTDETWVMHWITDVCGVPEFVQFNSNSSKKIMQSLFSEHAWERNSQYFWLILAFLSR
jgi:hypothetical protein